MLARAAAFRRHLLAVLALALLLVGIFASAVMAGTTSRPEAGRDLDPSLLSRSDGDPAGSVLAQDGGPDEEQPGLLDDDAEAADRIVEILPLEGLLDPPAAAAILDVIAQANSEGSELVVIQLASSGVVSADLTELFDAIEASAVPVAVFVGPRGVSAEAGGGTVFLMGAAHLSAMAQDAALGPVVPIDVADPITEDTRGAAREILADLWPEAADSPMLDDLVDRGLRVESGQFAGEEIDDGRTVVADADALAFVDVIAPGLEPLLVELDGQTVTTAAGDTTLRIRSDEVGVRFHSLGLVRRVLHAATTPVFIYVLFTWGLGMLLFEVFQPGFGVAGIAGLITGGIGIFGLTVLPITWWAAALVVLGLVLFAIDAAIAGFGPVTAAGTAVFAVGSINLYDSTQVGLDGWLVAANTIAALVFFVFVLTSVLRAQAGPETEAVGELVGRVGVVRSVLNPEGHVFIDGALWRARWIGDSRRGKVGTTIKVEGIDGPLVLVDAHEGEDAPPSGDEAAVGSPDESGS